MKSPATTHSIELLDALTSVIESPLPELADRFSALLRPFIGHSALLLHSLVAPGRPQPRAGDALIEQVTPAELDTVRRALIREPVDPWGRRAVLGGSDHPITAWTATTGALLVLTDPVLTSTGAADPEATQDLVGRLWQLVATSRRRVAPAPETPRGAAASSVSTEHATRVAALTDAHTTTLESLLAVLRSDTATDESARQGALALVVSAMASLRAASDRHPASAGEPVAAASERHAAADWRAEHTVSTPLDGPAAPPHPAEGWGLSPREQGVLALVATGARNRAIAAELSISENTVKFHVANLLRKVGAATRSELAARTR